MSRALRATWRALRGFLIGFTGMPAPRLDAHCTHDGGGAPQAARRALSERAARRRSCC